MALGFKVKNRGGVTIDGLQRLMNRLKGMEIDSRTDNNRQLAVGYTAWYAIYVHERLDLRHTPPTRAKFLEEPMRRLAPQMGKIARQVLRSGGTMANALIAAGEYLLKSSLDLVPVETGFLRKSSFIRLDKAPLTARKV